MSYSAIGAIVLSLLLAACSSPAQTAGPSAATPTVGLRVSETPTVGLATEQSPGNRTIVVQLREQNGSGINGRATLAETGPGTTSVEIQVAASTGIHPAHIHNGSCANLDPAPRWGLENVVNGVSTTRVNASLADILAGPVAVNLHRSPQEAETYVACGDIERGPG
jgi:hypothetical protein